MSSDGIQVQSVGRAFALLEAVGYEPSSLTELAKRVDLPVSTTARLLGTLEELEAVERVEGSCYRIGPSILNMAKGPDPTAEIQATAGPILESLAAATGEAAVLSFAVGRQMNFVAQVSAPGKAGPSAKDWVGARLPMHLVSAGLVALAVQSDEVVADYLDRDLARPTERSIVDRDAVMKRLKLAANAGTAWSLEELELGTNSVAAPVLDSAGELVAALHLHGSANSFPGDNDRSSFEDAVRNAASELSKLVATTQ